MVNTIKLMIAATALLSAPLVHGHGWMTQPKSKSTAGDITAYATTIDGPTVLPGGPYNWSPSDNTKSFHEALAKSSYKNIRDLIKATAKTGECGNTVLGDPQPLPDTVEWSHSSNEGFTPSHEGPCEVWCDDKLAFTDKNCAKNYPQAPAHLPYDKSVCTAAKVLTFYWLALHTPQWQVYISCAALMAGGGVPAPAPAPAPGTTPAPAPAPGTTPAPAPGTTPAPAPNTPSDAYKPAPATPPAGGAPAPAPKPAPAPAPETPLSKPAPAPGKGCGVKKD